LLCLFHPCSAPKDLKYTQSHEWVRVQGNIGTIGITSEAARQLGDIVFVDLPGINTPSKSAPVPRGPTYLLFFFFFFFFGEDVKKQFKAKNSFGAVESVKAASDVYAPIAGEVVEVNTALKVRFAFSARCRRAGALIFCFFRRTLPM
jgi:glycine cleavage system H lipoate-binding protein